MSSKAAVVELKFEQKHGTRSEGLSLNHVRAAVPAGLKDRITLQEWLATYDNVSTFLVKEKRDLWLKEGRRDGADITVVGENAWQKVLKEEQARYKDKKVQIALAMISTHAEHEGRRGSVRSIPMGIRFEVEEAKTFDFPGQSNPVAMDAVAEC
ncbi:expressed unknown protein [Seminavis robusta]|uniref:Uncharacterized protein n=1 Tax=Seminavis robusta TaxID=568900 RepID=A0A9N8H8H2_9STRA|nr:expressed unknown protein [Seminavis robusta]|eukprot:Sro240_g096160.1 n/a (154) ;mRNA; r:63705-64166